MFGLDVAEFADKMGDNVVVTTGAVGTSVLSEVIRALPAEIVLFAFVSLLIFLRLLLERAWRKHEAKAKAQAQAQADARANARRNIPPAKSRKEVLAS